jgi:hypothetical protein
MIEQGQQMTPEQIVRFLGDFRLMHNDQNQKSNLYTPEFQKKMMRTIIDS